MNEVSCVSQPLGWTETTLSNLLTVIRGVSYKKIDSHNEFREGLVPIIRATNIGYTLDFESLVYVPDGYVKREQFLRPGDIIVAASSGSRSVVGKAAQLKQEWAGSFGAFCFALRPSEGLAKEYIAWFLQTEEYRNRVSRLSAGVNINNLRRQHIEETHIPLPPLAEQHRIVAAIEQHLTRLDAAVTALQRVQANLQRYRASVLKTACAGQLVPTEAALARAEGRKYEHASQLLGRILVERRARWESQPKRRGRYKEPAPPDTSALPELPEGWVWSTLGAICSKPQYGWTTKAVTRDHGTRLLRTTDISKGIIDWPSVPFCREDPPSLEKYLLHSGDIVISRAGSVGISALILDCPEAVFASYLIRFRAEVGIDRKYLHFFLGSPLYWEQVSQESSGIALQNVNARKLASMTVPLPPLTEQGRIVAEVERRLSVIRQAETAVETSLKRAERLRQSILKQAFSGQLVPQDPNDEPAAVLLARIQAERAAASAAAKAQRTPRRRRRPRPAAAKQLRLAKGTP